MLSMDAWKSNFNWSNLTPINDYEESISYDPNGNIMGYLRNGTTQGGRPLSMDNLSYTYKPSTNQLDHVSDAVPANNYSIDIDNQSTLNYTYDQIGNLSKDIAEGIDTILWTVYGKIDSIHKINGLGIKYTYDAAGNRISKQVGTASTYYVPDASGNVMSVYTKADSINSGHLIQSEVHLYGSSRLGIWENEMDMEDTTVLLSNGIIVFKRDKKRYELNNHLGNVMATVSDRKVQISYNAATIDHFEANVLTAQDYYPFGMGMEGRRYGSGGYRYGFQNMEKVDEISGTGNHYVFGGYGLDVRLGRRWNTDPEISSMPSLSSYAVFKNNPIMFIDPSGRIPYPITIRGFAPFKSFGFGFHGDDRGYSTGDVTARVHQKINFDTDKTQIKTTAWSSPSFRTSDPHNQKTATPEVKFEGDFTIKQNGDNKTFGFGTHVAAGNPLTPQALTPNIDIFSNFSITENKKAGILNISGKLTGDNFPSTEAFISDPSGQNVFIGVGQIGAGVGQNTGPFTELPGENSTRPITDFNFSITTDKKGNFTGVKQGDKTFSIGDWNKQFTEKPTQKKEE